MKILHRYLLKIFLRNLALCLGTVTTLFLVFDFFERIDEIVAAGGGFGATLQYFLLKLPLVINLMLPISTLVASLLTFGLLSKQSEVTAMRSSGLSIAWISAPILAATFALSIISFVFSETVVPFAQRRANEVYNIDIKEKHARGRYSQEDVWWRSQNQFYSVGMFDSRSNKMHDLSVFEITREFEVVRRTDAPMVSWINPLLGWSMENPVEFRFPPGEGAHMRSYSSLPLPIPETPEDLYDARTDSQSMSFRSLRKYIKKQLRNGIPVTELYTDLHDKFSFPFIVFVITLVSLPFALLPARSGSLALSFIAGIAIGFAYYAVHSFSISLGRADIWPPFIAAWMANVLMGAIGVILNLGAESPTT